MAIFTYSITVDEIAELFPDPSAEPFGVGSDHGVTRSMITAWIEEVSGAVNSLLCSRLGVDADNLEATLTAEDEKAARSAIMHKVIARALRKLQRWDAAREYAGEYDAFWTLWSDRPEHNSSSSGASWTRTDTRTAPVRVWGEDHKW